MNITTIEMAREQAAEQYKLYSEAVKKRREPYLHDLKVLYGAMRTGRVVLDVWQSFKESGLDENGDPKIAIAPADRIEVSFRKLGLDNRWCGWFCPGGVDHGGPRWRFSHRSQNRAVDLGDVFVPNGTFEWKYAPLSPEQAKWMNRRSHPIREEVTTRVPTIPAAFLPPHGLSNYHILWEVEKWDVVTPPRDPLLLKRVSPNMFVVLAAWELTDLERAVLRGRIA